ncbi:hypothetical protein OPV22_031217 [Ensete ventricosum]|uniref:Stress-response A/B barrel domain-containing protein n=1 Tax=Ensete ventricosum TaxID=4639 RepID=A0AAV8NZ59_ENSVE|nr:hypothetical protein OPV22_031217 [Ensete ventricosum]
MGRRWSSHCSACRISSKKRQGGQDVMKDEKLGHGFTHAFILTFGSAEDLATYVKQPSHVEYGKAFRAAIGKLLVIDFPAVTNGSSTLLLLLVCVQ